MGECDDCGKPQPTADMYKKAARSQKFRCRQCNRDQKRLADLLRSDSETRTDLKTMSKKEMAEFMDQNRALGKAELHHAVVACVKKSD